MTEPLKVTIPDDDTQFALDLDQSLATFTPRHQLYRLVHIARIFEHTSWGRSAKEKLRTLVFPFLPDIRLYYNALDAMGEPLSDAENAHFDLVGYYNGQTMATLQQELANSRTSYRPHLNLGLYYAGTGEAAAAIKEYELMATDTRPKDAVDKRSHILKLNLDQCLFETGYGKTVLDSDEFISDCRSQLQRARQTIPKRTPATSPDDLTWVLKLEDTEAALCLLEGLKYLSGADFAHSVDCFLDYIAHAGDRIDKTWGILYCSKAELTLYITICSLAALPMGRVKGEVLASPFLKAQRAARPCLEQAMDWFMNNELKLLLGYLEGLTFLLLSDFRLYVHIPLLLQLIRDRALLFYLQTVSEIKIENLQAQVSEQIDADKVKEWVARLAVENRVVQGIDQEGKAFISLGKPAN